MEQHQESNNTQLRRRETRLFRKLSLLLLVLAATGLLVSYFQEAYYSLIGFSVFFVYVLVMMAIKRPGKSLFMVFSYAVFTHFFFLLPDIFQWVSKTEKYFAISFVFSGLTLFPLLLLRERKHIKLLRIALIVNILFIIFYDILVAVDEGKVLSGWISGTYLYYKIPQVVAWAIMVWAFHLINRENEALRQEIEVLHGKLVVSSHNEKKFRNINEGLSREIEEEKQKTKSLSWKLTNLKNELDKTKLAYIKAIDEIGKTKERLKKAEAEKENIWKALNDHYLVVLYDLDGNPEKMNSKAAAWLTSAGETLSMRVMPGKDDKSEELLNDKYFGKLWKQLKSGRSKTMDIRIALNDKINYITATFTPVFDDDGKPHKILVIGHDITTMVEQHAQIDRINAELNEKIKEISEKNQMMSVQQMDIFEKNLELERQKEKIQAINESLEERVRERTEILERKNKQLTEYAFINSHILRSPVSTMIGLINLMSYSDLPEKDKKLYEHLRATAQVLDDVIHKINRAIGSRLDFDREYVDPERKIRPV